jgi:Ca2+-binding RTX toxin-like protein
LWGGAGNDTIDGNEGNNQLDGGAGDDRIIAGEGDNLIWGGLGNDQVYTGNGKNVISAGEGNDLIIGGSGNDLIFAGEGDDILNGGLGVNYLNGGAGKDTFSILSAGIVGLNNTIADFTIGGDIIAIFGGDSTNLNIGSFGQLSISQAGADALIKNKAGLSVATLLNTDSSLLTSDSFRFS